MIITLPWLKEHLKTKANESEIIDKSIRLEFDLGKKLFPILFWYLAGANSLIPSLSSDKFNSDSEHNIP